MRTSFFVNELKILLDAGHQCYNKVQTIFITHTHADHIASLPLIILENVSTKLHTNIYCPKESVIFLSRMIDSFLMCNYHNTYTPKQLYRFIGVEPGDKIDLRLNNKNIKVEVFQSVHRISTVSYGFIECVKKLKGEYIGLDTTELIATKKMGIDIQYVKEVKKFVFCGDTTCEIFNDKNLLSYPEILIECTYFDLQDYDMSKAKKHMHWNDLKEIINDNTNVNFNIIHISIKHKELIFKDLIDATNVNIM